MAQPHNDLARILLVLLIIALLIAGSLWTLLPFLGALLWATTIVIATWPLLLRLQRYLGNHRGLATAVMTVIMLAVFILPFAFAVGALIDGLQEGAKLVKSLLNDGVQPPPSWVAKIPWFGPRLDDRWRELAAGGPAAVSSLLRPYVTTAAAWALVASGGIGMMIVHSLLTVVLAAILFVRGESAAAGVIAFARRLDGDRAERTVRLAGRAVRGVALGVIVTALVQSILAGIGLSLAGLPRPGLLLAATFILCVAQLGPLPVLAPAIIWLYWSGDLVWGTVLLVVTVIVAAVDNVLQPLLIRKGVALPLLLLVAGVIGGLIAFGVLGLFIGPVILAVTFTLLQQWIRDDPAANVTAMSPSARLTSAEVSHLDRSAT